MVMEEAHQRCGGEPEHLIRRRRPDRRRHGDQIEVEEVLAEPFAGAPVAQGSRLGLGGLPLGLGELVEFVDLEQQLPETQAEEVAPLGEEVIQRAATPFESGRVMADRKGHRGLLGLHAEFLEQAAEVRIGHLVEHHEPSVHRQGAPSARFGDVDRVGVAARPGVVVEDGDVVMDVQEAEAAEAAHAGANDGDPLTHAKRRPPPSCVPPPRRSKPARP